VVLGGGIGHLHAAIRDELRHVASATAVNLRLTELNIISKVSRIGITKSR
jgi:hypothetical protein